MKYFASKKAQKGQVLLLVVLASVIALTVGLAAVSRSITNTRVSTEESNSQKALSAAEAGIEEQINKALTLDDIGQITTDFSNNSGFISEAQTAIPTANNLFPLNNGELVLQDDGADLWLSNHSDFSGSVASANITVYWTGDSSDCRDDPAIEIAVVYGTDTNNPNMTRYTYDGCAGRAGENNFTLVSKYSDENGYDYQSDLGTISNGYIARIIPLYADAKVAIKSNVDLPNQGYIIESTGKSGDTVRKLQVYQGYPKLPIEFFPYNLFIPN